jgi:hypothetical protein
MTGTHDDTKRLPANNSALRVENIPKFVANSVADCKIGYSRVGLRFIGQYSYLSLTFLSIRYKIVVGKPDRKGEYIKTLIMEMKLASETLEYFDHLT